MDRGDLVLYSSIGSLGVEITIAGYIVNIEDEDAVVAVTPEATKGRGIVHKIPAADDASSCDICLVKIPLRCVQASTFTPITAFAFETKPNIQKLIAHLNCDTSTSEVLEGSRPPDLHRIVMDDKIKRMENVIEDVRGSSMRLEQLLAKQIGPENTSKTMHPSGPLTRPTVGFAQDPLLRGLKSAEQMWESEADNGSDSSFAPPVQRKSRQSQSSSRSPLPSASSVNPYGSQHTLPAPAPMDPTVLIQLKMLEAMERMEKRASKGSGSDSEDLPNAGKTTKGLKGIHGIRRAVTKNPQRIQADYDDFIKNNLGVRDSRQVWMHQDWATKSRAKFGKMTGTWRIYHALSHMLDTHAAGQDASVMAEIIQLQKALMQVAVDFGSWDNATLLLPYPDPLGTVDYGGTEREMEAVVTYRQGLRELKTRVQKGGKDKDSKDDKGE